ncbi:hypothetical protein ARMSODRAFT_967809 [Armillaria solidipes]|uniref:Uncharacterized protein n=1 Tax=Armillaria solidipes TaxID=1076256 RepID=A0A2H3AHG1_9AGAR|nr:hypothetical protein ARMSODRAFT_967809 [Armillaria solidipes]
MRRLVDFILLPPLPPTVETPGSSMPRFCSKRTHTITALLLEGSYRLLKALLASLFCLFHGLRLVLQGHRQQCSVAARAVIGYGSATDTRFRDDIVSLSPRGSLMPAFRSSHRLSYCARHVESAKSSA